MSQLTYHGGRIQTNPAIYVVFWGFSQSALPTAQILQRFLQGVGGSSWLDPVTEYYQSGHRYIGNSVLEFKGAWYDATDPVPRQPSNDDVAAEALRLSKYFRGVNTNAAYIVVTPSGRSTPGFNTQWCAYHAIATDGGGSSIAFANISYPDGGPCTGTVSSLSWLTLVGHELAEIQTDPFFNGWYDASQNEIADKCLNSSSAVAIGGNTFIMQDLWSNAARGCVL